MEHLSYNEPTSFQEIYDAFLNKITDDLYFENDGPGVWTKENTMQDLKNLLLDSIPGFEFPRFSLYDYDEYAEEYNCHLTKEEITIFALLMLNQWLQRQVTSIENTRQKFTGTDFKASSQANHLAKLMDLKVETERQTHHMQRLYKRRRMLTSEGKIETNWDVLRKSTFDNDY